MIVKTELTEEILTPISEQIGYMLSGLLEQQSLRPQSVELDESFQVWNVDLPILRRRLPRALSLLFLETTYWHHQILFDGEVGAHAISEVAPNEPPRVSEVSISPLAKKIDEAFGWVRSAERDWAKADLVNVRLLSLPAFLIHTFWLLDLRKIYVIDAIAEFAHLYHGLLLDEAAFLEALYADLRSHVKL